MKRTFLLTVSGLNQPGICSSTTSILARYQIDVLDIGQAVIHDALSLGMLIAISPDDDLTLLQQELESDLSSYDVRIRISEISVQEYENWVNEQGKPKHVITLLSRKLTSSSISEVSKVLARRQLDIYHITRLSGRVPLDKVSDQSQACVEFIVRGSVTSVEALQGELMALGNRLDVDIAYQEDNIHRRNRRLVVFDMDSTLIREEVIDELAKCAGSGETVAAITEAAMRGEIDFKQSLQQRVQTLKGLPESVLEEVAQNLHLNEGAHRLLAGLKRYGFKTAILSGGFSYFGQFLSRELGIDYVHANELEIVDGVMTGRVIGEIVDGDRKAYLLRKIAADHGLELDQVIAVGDGANDLPMLSIAGMGVAFHAKPLVRESANYALSNLGLDAILYLLGLNSTQISH